MLLQRTTGRTSGNEPLRAYNRDVEAISHNNVSEGRVSETNRKRTCPTVVQNAERRLPARRHSPLSLRSKKAAFDSDGQ